MAYLKISLQAATTASLFFSTARIYANEQYFNIHLKPNLNAESYFALCKYITIVHPTEGVAVP